MQVQRAHLEGHGVIAWLDDARRGADKEAIADAIASHFGIRRSDMRAANHRDGFFLTFEHRRHRETVAAACSFTASFGVINLRPWSASAHADDVALRHHVPISLENVPLEAWNEVTVRSILGDACELHYFDSRSLRHEDAVILGCWAWTTNLSKIPLVHWLTLTDAPKSSTTPTTERPGLQHRILVHPGIHEDHTKTKVETNEFDWTYGEIDGQGSRRQRLRSPARSGRSNRRHDDDDDDQRRGRMDDRNSGWRAFFCSRSRVPRDDGRGGPDGRRARDDDQDRQCGRDGRRVQEDRRRCRGDRSPSVLRPCRPILLGRGLATLETRGRSRTRRGPATSPTVEMPTASRSAEAAPACDAFDIDASSSPPGSTALSRTPSPPPPSRRSTNAFLRRLTQAVPAPLLPTPAMARRRAAEATARGLPLRRSARLACRGDKGGNSVAAARTVLLRRLGIFDVGGSAQSAAECYLDLFTGPLSQAVIQAIATLCGLDAPVPLPSVVALDRAGSIAGSAQ
ncbi:hypothetical protein BRADI_3g05351v3 [Brachypodium distachyon]|uniref:DUF4283 domain-containing protein n=1 Tax=Brachypodium distachyon TaxID=15368 RepID=A0A0Q3F263_BRADI|nr:hypothetical protein BRADI_3g05351v3 [Brachypodium distachyon]